MAPTRLKKNAFSRLISAAREWRYQPATMAGKPVKFRKMIQINVNRQ